MGAAYRAAVAVVKVRGVVHARDDGRLRGAPRDRQVDEARAGNRGVPRLGAGGCPHIHGDGHRPGPHPRLPPPDFLRFFRYFHGHLKRALDQALLLRGSRQFDDPDAYRRFVAELVGRHNARHRVLIDAERAALQPLPARAFQDFEREQVRVTLHSGFTLRKVFYSVPSRLIGHLLDVHLFADRLVLFLGGSELMTLPRGKPHAGGRGHVIDYHHVIHALRRKPMALLREFAVPRSVVPPGAAPPPAPSARGATAARQDSRPRRSAVPSSP